MKIEHIAIWAEDLKGLVSFYQTYFDASVSDLYRNDAKQFQSRFLTFASGARLELMQKEDIPSAMSKEPKTGYAHLAFSVGSRAAVDALTERLVCDGYEKLDGPRMTGDGFYESAMLDSEGNTIEITE